MKADRVANSKRLSADAALVRLLVHEIGDGGQLYSRTSLPPSFSDCDVSAMADLGTDMGLPFLRTRPI
jgi:hypothetical protein